MKKYLSILFAVVLVLTLSLVTAVPAIADDVSGDITVDTTWSTDMNFTGNVTVLSGATLTIEPGVTINLNSFSLIVNGVLDARGAEGNMIMFSSNPHIKLSGSGSDNSILSYCDISSVANWPCIEFDDSDATVEHSDIEYTSQQTHRAVIKVRNAASPTIQYNTIKGDSSDYLFLPGVKSSDAYEILVDDEVLDLVGCNPTIVGNTIDGDANVNGDTSESGILITNGNHVADVSTATITGNTIINHRDSGSPGPYGAYAGIEIREGCSATIGGSGNTIDNNIHGIFLEGSTPLGVYSTATIEGNTIKNGDYGIYAVVLNTPLTAHYNNIHDNAVYGVYMFMPSMDATNNWWGDCSGPTHAGNPGGTGDAVSDNVDYDPWWCPLVEIDIKPGSDPNSINLKSKGVVPVAVLTTEGFDASDVDPETVDFAGAEPVRSTLEDVDGDGDLDMLFHFKTQELEDLDENSTKATLTGTTYYGWTIEGTDSVNIVPKGKGK